MMPVQWRSGITIMLRHLQSNEEFTFIVEVRTHCKSCEYCQPQIIPPAPMASGAHTLSGINKSTELELPTKQRNHCLPSISLAPPSNPYSRLSFNQNGEISFTDSSSARGTLLGLELVANDEPSTHCNHYRLFSTAFRGAGKERLYLTVCSDASGITHWSQSSTPSLDTTFTVTELNSATSSLGPLNPSRLHPKLFNRWELMRLKREGYLLKPQLAPPEAIKSLLKRLNRLLGTPGMIVPGGNQPGIGKFVGGETNSQEVKNLLLSVNRETGLRVLDYVDALFGGVGACSTGPDSINAQIAFRYPEQEEQLFPNDDLNTSRRKIDGSNWHTDGLRKGQAHGFSLLVGVCLADVLEDFAGNLLVWPGSHELLHRCKYGCHGAIDQVKLLSELKKVGISSTSEDMQCIEEIAQKCSASSSDKHINEPQLPDLGQPLQIHCRMGDVVFVHPDTAHAGGPNYCHEIRKMVYFRLKCTCQCKCKCACDNHRATEGDRSSSDIPCCHECGCDCVGSFRNWEDVVARHALDMWADIPLVGRLEN